jgi:hypothetical protein
MGVGRRPDEGNLMELYPWVVFLHIAGAFLFAIAHGASAFAAFGIRAQRDPERIRALLDMSSLSLGAMYVGLTTLLVAGIAAGIMGNHFGRGWIWAALGVLIAVTVAMYVMASQFYARIRSAVGLPSTNDKKGAPPPAPVSAEELGRLLDNRRPELLVTIGGVGLLVLIWLMRFKPF